MHHLFKKCWYFYFSIYYYFYFSIYYSSWNTLYIVGFPEGPEKIFTIPPEILCILLGFQRDQKKYLLFLLKHPVYCWVSRGTRKNIYHSSWNTPYIVGFPEGPEKIFTIPPETPRILLGFQRDQKKYLLFLLKHPVYCWVSRGTRKNIYYSSWNTLYIVGFPGGPVKIFLALGREDTKLGYHCIASNTVSKEQKNYYNLYKQWNHGQSSIFHILTRLVRDKSNTTHPHVNLQLVMNPKANKSVCCYSYDIYRAYIKCLKKYQEWVTHTKTRKEVHFNTGLFISPPGTSELDRATTKKDTAERSISIGRESLKVFFVLGALAYLQVPLLGGNGDEKWRAQWIRKHSVSWNLPKLSQLWWCNGGFGPCTAQNHLQTKQFVSGTWNSSRVAACALRNEEACQGHRHFSNSTEIR